MTKTKNNLLFCITVILLGGGCSVTPKEPDHIAEIKKLNLLTDESQTMLVRSKKKQPADLIIPYGPEYIRKETFRAIPGIESVVMPDSVILIGDYVFANNRKLRKVRFSAQLKEIGKFTFFDCPALSEVILPPKLEKIGCSAFENCTSLKKIVIPETTKIIDDYAFANCTSLESIVIPASVKYIAFRAFKGCKNLKNVKIMNKNIILGAEVFDK